MNKELTSFGVKLSIFSVIAFAIIYFLQQTSYFNSSLYWLVWLFFICSTLFIHIILTKAAQQSGQQFIRTFMGLTAIKLFGYLIIIVVYAFLRKQSALPFTLCFLLMYFLYSAFEVITLYKYLRK